MKMLTLTLAITLLLPMATRAQDYYVSAGPTAHLTDRTEKIDFVINKTMRTEFSEIAKQLSERITFPDLLSHFNSPHSTKIYLIFNSDDHIKSYYIEPNNLSSIKSLIKKQMDLLGITEINTLNDNQKKAKLTLHFRPN